jgi:prolyl 4-hydroxylase
MDAAANDLERLAKAGDAEAQLALARQCEAANNVAMARGWYARAGQQGSVAAMRSLAINLLTREPLVEGDGVNMIRAAAHRGDGESAHVCAMLAAQDTALPDRWSVAYECLVRAADAAFAPAREQLNFLGQGFGRGDADEWTAALPIHELFSFPRIGTIEGFAGPEICDWLIERARPRAARAQVYDPAHGGGRVENARSNSSVTFDLAQSDIVLMLLRARIAASAGTSPQDLEASAVLHYAPGQQFEPHFDFLDTNVPGYARDVSAHGQRAATFLLYLNDDYEGGETEFPEIDFRFRGRKGDALLFWNVTREGAPDVKSRHAGLPPTLGEKWLLSQWIRQRPR